MAIIGSMTKQPREQLPVDIDYTAVIAGRTVSSMTATIEMPAGLTKIFDAITGNKLQIYIGSGTTGVQYQITVLMSIVIGGQTTIVEDEFNVLVEEV